MYSRMDLPTSDARRDVNSKKKYDLSLKRNKQKVQPFSIHSDIRETKESAPVVSKTRDTTSDFGDSQTFMLRLSDSFDANDATSEKPIAVMQNTESKTTEVIVISDSSDDASPDRCDWMRFKSSVSSRGAKNDESSHRSIHLINSSDSEDSDEQCGQSSKAGNVPEKFPAKDPLRKCSILYTSDDPTSETESGVSFGNKENIEKKRDTPEAQKIIQNVDKSLSISNKLRGILTENRCNINTPQSAYNPRNIIGKNEESKRAPISAKISSQTPILTKKDTRNILKAIKSTRLVYESPKDWKTLRVLDSSDSEESDTSSRVRKENENIVKQNGIVIAETESDSDDEVIQGSRVNIAKPHKTHVSRFLEPAIADETNVSEKKKLEVAQWLMTNSRDSRSDSSISNISPTQKNSPNSGNSSLERLEMNYETPNNRGKLRTPNTGAKSNAAASSTKSARQTTIDNFVKTSKDGTRKFLTPVATTVTKRHDFISPAVKEATEAMGLEDCADILDNLYGESWRTKANDLLPATEPRKANVGKKDKGIQTERKVNPKSKVFGKMTDSSSHEDDFDKFVQNIRPNLNSTKKPTAKTNRRRCSFINDSSSSSSSENGGESTYMTALTTPRISDTAKSRNRMTPISSALQRIKALCDSDSDDGSAKNKQPTDYRKHLSFSDDASNSSTSEYDPSDIIPPKVTAKPPIVFKTTKTAPKITSASIYAQQHKRTEKSKTFLESLSATIPLIQTHPDARKYRQNFKNTKEELCKYLYKLYNDKIFDNKLPSDMSIEWNVRMRGTAGFCYNKKSVKALGGVTRSSRLVLATKILDTPDRLRDTLVHEMCHAAAWLINEVSDGHGPFWKAWASKAMKAFPELPPIRRCHEYDIKTKFTYRCVGCGYSIGRHSKSLDVERKRCGHCYGKFELLINKITKSGTVEVKTPTTKKPTGFALFVKENYQTVKKERRGAAHKEVMQILGQQFSAIKITKKNGNTDENNSDSVSNDR